MPFAMLLILVLTVNSVACNGLQKTDGNLSDQAWGRSDRYINSVVDTKAEHDVDSESVIHSDAWIGSFEEQSIDPGAPELSSSVSTYSTASDAAETSAVSVTSEQGTVSTDGSDTTIEQASLSDTTQATEDTYTTAAIQATASTEKTATSIAVSATDGSTSYPGTTDNADRATDTTGSTDSTTGVTDTSSTTSNLAITTTNSWIENTLHPTIDSTMSSVSESDVTSSTGGDVPEVTSSQQTSDGTATPYSSSSTTDRDDDETMSSVSVFPATSDEDASTATDSYMGSSFGAAETSSTMEPARSSADTLATSEVHVTSSATTDGSTSSDTWSTTHVPTATTTTEYTTVSVSPTAQNNETIIARIVGMSQAEFDADIESDFQTATAQYVSLHCSVEENCVYHTVPLDNLTQGSSDEGQGFRILRAVTFNRQDTDDQVYIWSDNVTVTDEKQHTVDGVTYLDVYFYVTVTDQHGRAVGTMAGEDVEQAYQLYGEEIGDSIGDGYQVSIVDGSPPESGGGSDDSGLETWAIVLIVLGCVVVMTVFVITVIYCYKLQTHNNAVAP